MRYFVRYVGTYKWRIGINAAMSGSPCSSSTDLTPGARWWSDAKKPPCPHLVGVTLNSDLRQHVPFVLYGV
jgi:hypothetical protein